MSSLTAPPQRILLPDAPLCIIDAYISERQRFNLLFLPGDRDPRKYRLLDDLFDAVALAGFEQAELHTYSFVTTVTIAHIRTPLEKRAWYDPD